MANEVFVHKCDKCGGENVLDRKPAAKIQVICTHCGEELTVDPGKKQRTEAAQG